LLFWARTIIRIISGRKAFDKAWHQFLKFCEATEPVPLCTTDFLVSDPFPVHILTHDKVGSAAKRSNSMSNASSLCVDAGADIAGSTSGGPVVTGDGLRLGVISHAGGPLGGAKTEVGIPLLYLTAPGYLLRTMLDPEWERRARVLLLEKLSIRVPS